MAVFLFSAIIGDMNKKNLTRADQAENGASEGIRTLDIHLGKVKLYH